MWCWFLCELHLLHVLQVKAYGPGLDKTGCVINKVAEFTVDAKDCGRAPLKIFAQVRLPPLLGPVLTKRER